MGKNARTFGQDLMRGEHVVGGGRLNKRKANAQVSGGGGGWKEHNEKMAANRAKLQNKNLTWVKGDCENLDDTSRKNLAGGVKLRSSTSSSAKAMQYAGGVEGTPVGQSGTSIFDPVLCELAYRWFCPPGGSILDPFAGGSVRGIVASHLGRKYTGIDLRAEQLDANRAQIGICKDPHPRWIEGDSRNIKSLLPKGEQFDFVFSCPPYWNLEVYSENLLDLSTLGADDFFAAQSDIIGAACSRLKNNRFAGWIVGDVRDSKGLYVNLPGRSIQAFGDAGLRLYNDAILITAAGSLPIRAGKQFESSRKLGKTHQNVLIFCKGDPVKATKDIGPVEFGAIGEGDTELAAYGEVL
jgi:hypothetical protein